MGFMPTVFSKVGTRVAVGDAWVEVGAGKPKRCRDSRCISLRSGHQGVVEGTKTDRSVDQVSVPRLSFFPSRQAQGLA